MPMYEYRCESCGEKWEKLRRMADADAEQECPECRSKRVLRVVSGFATTGSCGPGPGGRGFT